MSKKGNCNLAVKVFSAPYQDVKDAVEKAVMQWKFKPALKKSVKVKVWKPVVVRIKR